MRIENEIRLDFKDVLIRPKRSTLKSRSQVDLNRTFLMPHTGTSWTGIPIIAANMDTVGTFAMAKKLAEFNVCTAIHKHYPADELIAFWRQVAPSNSFAGSSPVLDYTFYSIGITDADEAKFKQVQTALTNEGRMIDKVCIDVANGYSEAFVDFIKRFRDENPTVTIMAGNVVTGEMTEELILSGADIVKVGIGPGSVCTTRKMTGVGYPQLSAIIECADAAHGVKGMVCGDGGCTVPGDLAKAFGGGADFIMLGGMLAGHDQCDGEITNLELGFCEGVELVGNYSQSVTEAVAQYKMPDGTIVEIDVAKVAQPKKLIEEYPTVYRWVPGKRSTMKFYGMSSKDAQEKHNGGVKEYRASEGKCVEVPYRGPVEGTMREILGGIRSACTYTGSATLKELSKRTTFVRVSQQINEVFGKS